MKIKNNHVLWTVYFNSIFTRNEGRRLSNRECVPDPKLNEIEEACSMSGLNVIQTKQAFYPRMPLKNTGYVLIEKTGEKNKVMKIIGKNVRKIRGRKKL